MANPASLPPQTPANDDRPGAPAGPADKPPRDEPKKADAPAKA